MNKELPLYAVLLSELPHVGERTALEILERCQERGHSLAMFFHLPGPVLRREFALPEPALRCLERHREAHRRRCEWLATKLVAHGGQAWTLLDRHYPERLQLYGSPPPPLLFVAGDVTCLQRPTLAVLHSRAPTEEMVAGVRRAVELAAREGFAVVTSAGKATYRLVAIACRALGVPRVVVLDRGLFAALGPELDCDPCTHAREGSAEAPARGQLVLSPFRLLDHAVGHNGPRRDALVVALADVVFALHARPGGQIERVCLTALDQGRPVLSWNGENPGLVAAGATAVTDADLRSFSRFLGAR